MRHYELSEGDLTLIPAADLAVEQALDLHARYPHELDLTFPSPLNGHCYQLRSRGVVGLLPFGQGAVLEISPIINCSLLMSMMECAYQLPKLSDDMVPATMGEIYELWADILAAKILHRTNHGLYMGDKIREEQSQWVRGRMLIDQNGANVYPRCRYVEYTKDVIENRILASALNGLRRFVFKRDDVRRKVFKAWWGLNGLDYRSIGPIDCMGLQYHRLNQDYKFLHALCYPFLQQRSPSLGGKINEGEWLGYTIHMPTLFERFSVEYLSLKLRHKVRLESQYPTRLKGSQGLSFRLDMALFKIEGHKPLAVIDTKYKFGGALNESDVQQVVAYAVQLGVSRAFLLYPTTISDQIFEVGSVQVQALGFDFNATDVEQAGLNVVLQLEKDL